MNKARIQERLKEALKQILFIAAVLAAVIVVLAAMLFGSEWMEANWQTTKDIFWLIFSVVVAAFVVGMVLVGKGIDGRGPGSQ